MTEPALLSEVECGPNCLRAQLSGRRFEGPLEAVALELWYRHPGIAAKSFGVPEESYRMFGVVGVACVACVAWVEGDEAEDAELGATDRGTGQQIRSRVDAVGQPAWFAGEVQLECFGCRGGRGGVSAVESMQ
ncbi:MAG: hypothetical protein QOE00_491, partial [Ilumatobacteraceae bacterium]